MKKRIMICGASGTGKTALAKHISELYELPFVSTSAKKLWKDFGFVSHKDVRIKSFSDSKLGMEYQTEILLERGNILRYHDKFVTDRSFVDNVVYMLMDLSHTITNGEVEDFLRLCRMGMVKCDLLIFIRWTDDIVFQDDKNRITNRYYQAMVDKIIEWILYSGYITDPVVTKVKEIDMWDFESRIKLVGRWVK